MTTVEHKTLAEAFLAAQAEMPAVGRDGKNPHFNSSFTTLDHLLAKTRPVLNRHGLSVIQLPSHVEGRPALRTVFLHVSGEQMEDTTPLLLPKNDPQGQGSALTYAKRYALASALAIADQEDDDGNAGSDPKVQTIPRERASSLYKAAVDKGMDFDAISALLGSVGGEPPAADTAPAYAAAFTALTGQQGDEVERKVALG